MKTVYVVKRPNGEIEGVYADELLAKLAVQKIETGMRAVFGHGLGSDVGSLIKEFEVRGS